MIRGIVILLLIELIVPVLFGSLFALSDKKVNSRIHFLLSSLASGQIVLYAVFQSVGKRLAEVRIDERCTVNYVLHRKGVEVFGY